MSDPWAAIEQLGRDLLACDPFYEESQAVLTEFLAAVGEAKRRESELEELADKAGWHDYMASLEKAEARAAETERKWGEAKVALEQGLKAEARAAELETHLFEISRKFTLADERVAELERALEGLSDTADALREELDEADADLKTYAEVLRNVAQCAESESLIPSWKVREVLARREATGK